MSKDAYGTDYATINLKAGDTVRVDDGFKCLKRWSTTVVEADESGCLFIPCSMGRHYLSGQQKRDHYVGIYPA